MALAAPSTGAHPLLSGAVGAVPFRVRGVHRFLEDRPPLWLHRVQVLVGGVQDSNLLAAQGCLTPRDSECRLLAIHRTLCLPWKWADGGPQRRGRAPAPAAIYLGARTCEIHLLPHRILRSSSSRLALQVPAMTPRRQPICYAAVSGARMLGLRSCHWSGCYARMWRPAQATGVTLLLRPRQRGDRPLGATRCVDSSLPRRGAGRSTLVPLGHVRTPWPILEA